MNKDEKKCCANCNALCTIPTHVARRQRFHCEHLNIIISITVSQYVYCDDHRFKKDKYDRCIEDIYKEFSYYDGPKTLWAEKIRSVLKKHFPLRPEIDFLAVARECMFAYEQGTSLLNEDGVPGDVRDIATLLERYFSEKDKQG